MAYIHTPLKINTYTPNGVTFFAGEPVPFQGGIKAQKMVVTTVFFHEHDNVFYVCNALHCRKNGKQGQRPKVCRRHLGSLWTTPEPENSGLLNFLVRQASYFRRIMANGAYF